jgi:GNAT superfamily N-acetyltransferase
MTPIRLHAATRADLPRSHEVRHGTAENRLSDPGLVTDEEVAWYMDHAIFLVSEDEVAVQGFTCVNHQSGYVWALFVIDQAQGRGHGSLLHDAATARVHCQAFLSTGDGTGAEAFYLAKGWTRMGLNLQGEVVLRLFLRAGFDTGRGASTLERYRASTQEQRVKTAGNDVMGQGLDEVSRAEQPN